MLVKCIKNRTLEIEATQQEHFSRHVRLDELNLTKGMSYVVMGLVFRDQYAWYLICEEEDDDYPKPHFSGLFEVGQRQLAEGLSVTHHADGRVAAILPDEWVNDPHFLEKLVDGDTRALEVFRSAKRRLTSWERSVVVW